MPLPTSLYLPTIIQNSSTSSTSCCSSISADSYTQRKKKVIGKKYSRLAFFVDRLKTAEESDDASIVSLDSSLSSENIPELKQEQAQKCIITFEKKPKMPVSRAGVIAKGSRMFGATRKLNTNHNLLPGTIEEISKKKVTQSRYSKIAYSVQSLSVMKRKSISHRRKQLR
jgi:hypothetical protein